jgi:aminobenzoyl-glutamate transport protein
LWFATTGDTVLVAIATRDRSRVELKRPDRMSEQRRITSIDEPEEKTKTFLDVVEKVGNKVLHPAVIFFILSGLVIVLLHLFYLLGTSVDYEVVNPQTHQVEHTTAAVNSLLSGVGIRFMLTSMIWNFMNFAPVGIIFVVMIGVGLAEQAGLMTALIKKIVQVTPRKAVTWILVTVGVLASIAADAGYLVLIPLGAAAFLGLGRHPLPGWRRPSPESPLSSASIF